MHISLTPQLEDYVKSKVASGLYNNASEVIRQALRYEMEREPDYDPAYVAWVNSELEIGLQQIKDGKGTPWDREAFDKRLKERRAKRIADRQAA